MTFTRRDLLKFLMSAAVAESMVDWERLIWTPKPIITVPAMPTPKLINRLWRVDYDPFLTAVARDFAQKNGSVVVGDGVLVTPTEEMAARLRQRRVTGLLRDVPHGRSVTQR